MNSPILKTGARFRITTPHGRSGWGLNLILNSAKDLMASGFNAEPEPILGQSILEVDPTQTGVQAPLPNMVMESSRTLAPPKMERVNDQTCKVTYRTEYTFRNNAATQANISEIGFANLNRALFKDEDGVAKAWPVADQERVLVEMEFVIVMSTPAVAANIDVVDNNGTVVDTIAVTMTTMFDPTQTAVWWKLLSPNTSGQGINLVTDTNWNGFGLPLPENTIPASADTSYEYVDRNIAVGLEHMGAVGGQTIKGYFLTLAGKPPYICAVFDKPLTIGGNYTFKSTLSIDW